LTRVLPESLRDRFKEPFGSLVTGSDPVETADNAWPGGTVIAVGDIVSYNLYEAGHQPKLSVIDDRSMREETDDDFRAKVRRGYDATVEAENPPGHLTDELVDAVRSALEGDKNVQIVIDGEEDLAVLPAVQYAEESSKVIYGQPGEGVVVVEVTEEMKREINRLVDKMEVINGD